MTELLVLHIAKREILAVSLDGSRVRTLVTDVDETPDGIVVDQARGHIYWTNMGTPDPESGQGAFSTFFTRNGSLERVNLDGSDRRTIVPRGVFTTGKQLTADFDAGLLYWCDREGMQVLRSRLDGSGLETLVVAGTDAQDPRNHCVGIAVDPVNRLLYWTQKGAPDAGRGRIFRCGTEIPAGQTAVDRDDIELLWQDLPEPIDLDLDGSGNLVWTDRGAEPDGNTLNRGRVQPAVGPYTILSRGFQEAIGLATADDTTYYVSELRSGGIREVNLADGTSRELAQLGPGVTGVALAEL
jgi:DNA-binding beta-propeller fold protein YncE